MIVSKFFKNPFLCTVIFWLFLFLSFACFKIDGVTPVNYIAAMAFFGAVLYFSARHKEKIRKVPRQKQKSMLYMLGGAVYGVLMMYTFDHVRSNPAIRSRNEMVPLFFLLAALIVYSVITSVKKKWCEKKIIFVIIILSSIVHLFYMMTAKFNVAQWDMYTFSTYGQGHCGYIEYLYNNFIPAQFDPRRNWQYYHPPLHHIIEAILLRIQTMCGVDFDVATYNILYPPMLYAMLSTVCTYLICKELKLRKTAIMCATAVVAFSPAFVYVGGFGNNDMLSIMWIFLCILYTLRWYQVPTIENIIKIALCFGLGMFSKMSASLIAPSVAVIFIYRLVKSLKDRQYRKFKKYFGQMWIFLAIAAPLGLYWSFRNLIRFGVPLGYVPQSEDKLHYISIIPFIRLLDFNPKHFANPYFNDILLDPYNEYNPLIALMKTSASDVGVLRFILGDVVGHLILWSAIATAAAAFILMIYIIFRKNTLNGVYKVFFGVLYVVYLVSYEYFCIKYPYTCTEQIRYAMPLILIGAVFIGLGLKKLFEQKSLIYRTFGYLTVVSVGVFSLTSIATFIYYGIIQTVQMMM